VSPSTLSLCFVHLWDQDGEVYLTKLCEDRGNVKCTGHLPIWQGHPRALSLTCMTPVHTGQPSSSVLTLLCLPHLPPQSLLCLRISASKAEPSPPPHWLLFLCFSEGHTAWGCHWGQEPGTLLPYNNELPCLMGPPPSSHHSQTQSHTPHRFRSLPQPSPPAPLPQLSITNLSKGLNSSQMLLQSHPRLLSLVLKALSQLSHATIFPTLPP
jgi:hypothetical protein